MTAADDVLALTRDLIARRSITTEDAGCQALIAARLERSGFRCEHLRFGQTDNLWPTKSVNFVLKGKSTQSIQQACHKVGEQLPPLPFYLSLFGGLLA